MRPFGDVTRWIDGELAVRPSSDAAARLLHELDNAYPDGDDEIRELIAVSVLEKLDDNSPTVAALPPRLRAARSDLVG